MQKLLTKKLVVCASAALIFTFAADAFSAQSNWTAFWRNFRIAVVKNDKFNVVRLSQVKLSEEEYQGLFGTRARRNCFAKAKPVKDKEGGYSVFCGEQGYYFKKVGGQFKFTDPFPDD